MPAAHRLRLWLAALLLVGGIAAEPAETEPDPDTNLRRVPGTRVYLVRPEGFVQSDAFSGFKSVKGRAQLVVSEAPQSLAQLRQSHADEALVARGWKILSREPVTVDKRPGELIVATQSVRGGTIQHWVLLFGVQKRSVLISASCPARASARYDPIFRATLLNARWIPLGTFDPFEGLGFDVRGEYRLVFAVRAGSEVTFTKDGLLPLESPEDPAFVVKLAREEVPEGEREQFCVKALEEGEIFEQSQVIAANPIFVDGLQGCEALAQGLEKESRQAVAVYQGALFARRQTFLFKGRYGLRFQDPWLGQFRAMVAALRRR